MHLHPRSLLPKPKREVTRTTDSGDAADQNGGDDSVTNGPATAGTQLVATHNGGSPAVVDRYEVIARMGHASDRLVQMRPSDMQPRTAAKEELARPSPAQVAEETEATRRALESIIMEKTAKTQPKNVTASVARAKPSELIQYTPRETASSGGEPPQVRIIKMAQAPVDPLEPPRFHHKRVPRAPPSPPAPRLHSPPRRVTAEEQRTWHIPPCISSWKNPKGYTVPLDKRLASDGRTLQERTVNGRISDLAEALFLAEKHNREEVELRRDVQRKLAEAEARQKDEQLRRMAEEAREEKRRLNEAIRREEERERRLRDHADWRHRERVSGRPGDAGHDDEHRSLSLGEREKIRRERDYEREREYRLSRMPAEQRARVLERETERDIGERIALGMAPGPAAGAVGEHDLFDERLFDRGGGLGTSFGAGDDETYNVYDRPLRDDRAIHMIYQPRIRPDGTTDEHGQEAEAEAERAESGSGGKGIAKGRGLKIARPDKAFAGTSAGLAIDGGSREGPVQFERHSQNRVIGDDQHGQPGSAGERRSDDPFGLDQFLSAAKKSRKEGK